MYTILLFLNPEKENSTRRKGTKRNLDISNINILYNYASLDYTHGALKEMKPDNTEEKVLLQQEQFYYSVI